MFIFVLLLLPGVALAGISAPNSSTVLSADGTKLLVMLSPDVAGDYKPTVILPDGRTVNLHDVVSKSGLYESLSLRPIWQVEWYSLPWDLVYSGDLRYVVRMNREGFRSTWALAFYDQGKLTRTYNCSDLLTGMGSAWCLPYSTWDWHVVWYDHFSLNPRGDQVVLSTARRQAYFANHEIDLGLQEFYVFDLASGSMVAQRSSGRWLVWVYAAGAVLFVFILFALLRFLIRRIKMLRIRNRRGFPVG